MRATDRVRAWLCGLALSVMLCSPCPALHAEPGVRFVRQVNLADLTQVRLPVTWRVAAYPAALRSGPRSRANQIASVPVGTEVTVVNAVEGDKVINNCGMSPYDGCIQASTVWLEAQYKGSSGATQIGYLPVTVFHAWDGLTGQQQTIERLFGLRKLGRSVTVWGQMVKGWKLPPAGGRSVFDECGWGSALTKLVVDGPELVASRRELEYLARSAAGGRGFRYDGSPRRLPEHWREFPALVQDINFDPALSSLWITETSVQRATVRSLEGTAFFTFHPAVQGNGIPILFRPEGAPDKAIALLLFKESAASCFKAIRSTVRTSRGRPSRFGGCVEQTSTTTVDLNSDDQEDIVRFETVFKSASGNALDCESAYTMGAVAMHHQGAWYLSGLSAPGQDGREGF